MKKAQILILNAILIFLLAFVGCSNPTSGGSNDALVNYYQSELEEAITSTEGIPFESAEAEVEVEGEGELGENPNEQEPEPTLEPEPAGENEPGDPPLPTTPPADAGDATDVDWIEDKGEEKLVIEDQNDLETPDVIINDVVVDTGKGSFMNLSSLSRSSTYTYYDDARIAWVGKDKWNVRFEVRPEFFDIYESCTVVAKQASATYYCVISLTGKEQIVDGYYVFNITVPKGGNEGGLNSIVKIVNFIKK